MPQASPVAAGDLSLRRLAVLIALGLALGAYGCASGADEAMRGDVASAQPSNKLTPEQCMAGGEIQQAAARPDDEGYVIQPGDVLWLDLYLNPEFNDEITVRPDGKVTMRMIGDIRAAGRTPPSSSPLPSVRPT